MRNKFDDFRPFYKFHIVSPSSLTTNFSFDDRNDFRLRFVFYIAFSSSPTTNFSTYRREILRFDDRNNILLRSESFRVFSR